MINLLPPNTKKQMRAARSNVLLLRYNFLLIGALVFVLIAIGGTYFYLDTAKGNAEQLIEDSQTQAGRYASVQQDAESYRQKLATAKQILDQDVAYTKVILEIAKTLPSGVVIDKLSLDAKTFGSPTTFTARARDYQSALNLKDSLSDSSLFYNVSIASMSGGGGEGYPININLNVTIQKDAAKRS